jgi:hypothetical protein
MKSFIVALSVLIVVITFVFFNSLYITNLFDDFYEDAQKLPPDVSDENCEKQVSDICKRLDEKASYLYTVMGQKNVDELLCTFSDMLSYSALKYQNGYTASLNQAKLILNLIKDNENFPSLPFFFSGQSKKRYFP